MKRTIAVIQDKMNRVVTYIPVFGFSTFPAHGQCIRMHSSSDFPFVMQDVISTFESLGHVLFKVILFL